MMNNKYRIMRAFLGLAVSVLMGNMAEAITVDAFVSAVENGDGWYSDPSYGDFYPVSSTWIWHEEHGWQWIYPDHNYEDGGIYVWDDGMSEWWWTWSGIYPWVYAFGDATGWQQYQLGGTPGARTFYSLSDGSGYWRYEAQWSFPMVASGQTDLYNDDGEVISDLVEGDPFYGQDANYLKGAEMAYEDNGDGTVTDLNTGLMWQQVPSSNDYTWQEAHDYCEDLVYAGYDDWRMPSCKELYSISNFGLGWPYLDTDYFSLASGEVTKDEQFWSSNYYVGVTVEGGEDAAFGVNHVTGHIKAYSAKASGPIGGKYVRAVRGDAYGVNQYVDNGDGTITDVSTGLMWAQDDDGVTLDWENALAYAENSELAGYTDWRMPNVKELQGIVDYSYSPSATNEENVGPAIDPIFSCTEMVNEAGDSDYGYYWTSTSANFTSGEPYYYAWYVAFGRAVDDNGDDFHGAGAVRFDTKAEDGPLGEGGERYYNYIRLVRDAD